MPLIAIIEMGIMTRLAIQRRVRLIKKEMGFRLVLPLVVEEAIIPPIFPRLVRLIQERNASKAKKRLIAR